MKRKLLFVCTMLLGLSAWAQTDVTSTYLDNPGFDEGPFISAGVCTYAKDVAANGADGSSLMAVTSWTAGDSGDAKAGAAFEFGSNAFLTGTGFKVPSTNSEGNAEGGALGLGGCWGGNAYYTQNLKTELSAGTYTIEICGYNAGTATAFGVQTFGIKEANGTTHYVTTTWTAGQWTTATLKFEISASTAATFYLGATNVAGGSDKSAKLFIDYVKIYKSKSLQELMDEATEANPSDVTAFYLQNAAVTGIDGWTNGRISTGQQYEGAPDNTYLDTWNATLDQKQVVKLKAGKYTLKAATRAVEGITVANIYANIKDGAKQNKDITAVGNTGGELGRGWGWTTVDFLVMEDDKEVTIGFYSDCGNNKWAGADNFSLLYDRKIQDSDKIPAAKAELKVAIEAKAKIAENEIGASIFLYPSAGATEYNDALDAAQAVVDNESATLAEVEAKTTALKAMTRPALNAPDANQAYAIVLKFDGYTYDNKAITYSNDREDQGGYNLKYADKGQGVAQEMYFTAAEGTDNYTIHFIDAENAPRYICTGIPYSGNTSQIRTTDDASKALVVNIRRAGDFINLFNTEANQFIGSQDAGVFTLNSHINFVVEVSANLQITEAGVATFCAPFEVDLNDVEGVEATAYTAEVVDGWVALTEVEGNVIPAGTAVVLTGTEMEEAKILTGVPTADKAETGCLVGNLGTEKVEVAANAGNYLLQNQEQNGLAWYLVDGQNGKLYIGVNRCYLKFSGDNAREFFPMDFDNPTGIDSIATEAKTKADGKYLVNGKIVVVKAGKVYEVK